MPHKHDCLPATFQSPINDPSKQDTNSWNLQATPLSSSPASIPQDEHQWFMNIDDASSLSSCDTSSSLAETASTSTPSLITSPSPQHIHPYNLRIRHNDHNRYNPEEIYQSDGGVRYVNKKRRRQLSVSNSSPICRRRQSKPIVIGTPRPVSVGSARITSQPPRPLSRLVVSCALVDNDLSQFSVLPHS